MAVALALVAGGFVAPGPALADGPLLQGSPWPEMRHDLRNTGESQIRGTYRGERPWSFTHPARDLLDPGDRRPRASPTSARPTATSTRSGATARSCGAFAPAGSSTRPPPSACAPAPTTSSRSRSAPATRRSTSCAAPRGGSRPPSAPAGPSARRWRRRPASWSTGGRATSPTGPTRTSTSATPAAAPSRSRPSGEQRWVTQRGELGLDHARVRRRGQQLLGLGRLLRLLARPGRQPALADVHPRLSDLLAGARLRRHRLHRLLRPLAARARPGHRRRALGLPDRRPHLQLARARLRRRRQHQGDLHRLGRRLDLRRGARRHRAVEL